MIHTHTDTFRHSLKSSLLKEGKTKTLREFLHQTGKS